ncbi:hypothetical protein PAXRUDRAFT_159514 [Paxillus rubicundulus Ve08.2h10]|uniref:Uncharacterized protein n=1 Tax=Paxillus rubicundulus Ve08.2h10 TaxID=930991 RepID=A0A0D0DNE8_9AGAM|nr:hypothetical protein PAXRUDRAFT_159514 [Paxillus rubicundulus Ve08.2h10]
MHNLSAVFEALERCQTTMSLFIVIALTSREYDSHHTNNLLENSTLVFAVLLEHPSTANKCVRHSIDVVKGTYLWEIQHLASEESGWHFAALNATTKQLEGFNIEDMA